MRHDDIYFRYIMRHDDIFFRYIMRNDLEHGVKAMRECHIDIKPKSMSPAIKTEIPAETIKFRDICVQFSSIYHYFQKDPLTKENQNQNS